MRYRAMDANGDYQFAGASPFLTDSPAAVAQAILTRLRLSTGEWFLDTSEGLDESQILGYGTEGTRDLVIQARIRGTPGVLRIASYSSSTDPATRAFTVVATVDTIYGQTNIDASF